MNEYGQTKEEEEEDARNERAFAWVLAVVGGVLLLCGIWLALHNPQPDNPQDCIATLSQPC